MLRAALFLICMLASFCFARAEEVRLEATVEAGELNVRAGPGLEHAVMGSLWRDVIVTVLERRGDWARVETTIYNRRTVGWVNGRFLGDFNEVTVGDLQLALESVIRTASSCDRLRGSMPDGRAHLVPQAPMPGNWAARSADGALVATPAGVWRVADGQRVAAFDLAAEGLAFLPDGRSLLAVGGAQIAVIDLEGDEPRLMCHDIQPWASGLPRSPALMWGEFGVPEIAVSPDGLLAAIYAIDGLFLWHLEAGSILHARGDVDRWLEGKQESRDFSEAGIPGMAVWNDGAISFRVTSNVTTSAGSGMRQQETVRTAVLDDDGFRSIDREVPLALFEATKPLEELPEEEGNSSSTNGLPANQKDATDAVDRCGPAIERQAQFEVVDETLDLTNIDRRWLVDYDKGFVLDMRDLTTRALPQGLDASRLKKLGQRDGEVLVRCDDVEGRLWRVNLEDGTWEGVEVPGGGIPTSAVLMAHGAAMVLTDGTLVLPGPDGPRRIALRELQNDMISDWDVEEASVRHQLQVLRSSPDGRRLGIYWWPTYSCGACSLLSLTFDSRTGKSAPGSEANGFGVGMMVFDDGSDLARTIRSGGISGYRGNDRNLDNSFYLPDPWFGEEAYSDGVIAGIGGVCDLNNVMATVGSNATMSERCRGPVAPLSVKDEIVVPATGERIKVRWAEDGRALLVTSDGFFAVAGPDGPTGHSPAPLGIAKGLDLFDISRAFNALYRPELVREALSGDPDGLVAAAATELDLDTLIESGLPPVVDLLLQNEGGQSRAAFPHQKENQPDLTTSNATVTLAARLTDRGGGFGEVAWSANGTVIERQTMPAAPIERGRTIQTQLTLTLEPGENVIAVQAMNAAGLIESNRAKIKVRSTRKDVPRRLHILAVGVDEYLPQGPRALRFAASDARYVAASLCEATGGVFEEDGVLACDLQNPDLYEEVRVELVLNKVATADGIEAALDRLLASDAMRPEDTFVMFMSGHGEALDGYYYFLPQDIELGTGKRAYKQSIRDGGIARDQIEEWLARVPARRSVILYDTCKAGAAARFNERNASQDVERAGAVEKLARGTGRWVIAASTDEDVALEGLRGRYGAFTYSLLEALNEADGDNDAYVSVTELEHLR